LQLTETSASSFLNGNGTSFELDVNRHPENGSFGDTNKSHARINLTGADGGSYIAFNTASANNTTATERMRIEADGDVGIGTSSPSARLQVRGSSEILRIEDSSSTGNPYMSFYQNGTRRSFIQHQDSGNMLGLASEYGGIRFMTATNGSEVERMRIDSSGRVGIGTTNPGATLDVYKNDSTAYNASDDGAQRGNGATILARNDNGTVNSFAQLVFDTAGTNQSIARIVAIRTSTSSNDMAFVVEGGNTKREAMRIISSGNVGIGTTSPGAKLDLTGNSIDNVGLARFTNNQNGGGVYYPTASFINTRGNHSYGIVADFRINTASDGDRPSMLFFGQATSTSWQVGQQTSTNWGGASDGFGIGYRASNDPTSFTGWPTAYFTVDTNGNTLSYSSSRAPIFYDSDNTSFFVNPASTSEFNQIDARYFDVEANAAYALRFWGGSHNYSIRMSQSSNNTYGGRVAGETTSDYNMYFTMSAGTNRGFVFRSSNSSSSAVAGIDASGNGRFIGDVVAYSSSDERLKDNKKNIDNALEKVESLNGVEFDWNDKQDVYEGHDIGVIAQEVEKIAPELVSTRDNGYKAVKYEKLVPLLIEAVKELSEKVKILENK
jgi:hypothetical protein